MNDDLSIFAIMQESKAWRVLMHNLLIIEKLSESNLRRH